ncbi:MAG: Ig-like domain-containing protein, partial [Nitrospirales bacterium]
SHTLKAVARDILGVSWNSNTITVTVSNDTTRPTVSISQATGQLDPTNTSPINFTAAFSENVSGFTNADVAITGTAGGTKTVAVSGGPRTYNVAVSGMTTAGTVIATIPAGVAFDAATNPNTASTSTDNTVTFETAAPPTVTRFEESNPAVSFSPDGTATDWIQIGSDLATFSEGNAFASDVAGATATFTFTGTKVSWIGLKCNICGIATVSIDGEATMVNTAGAAAPGDPGLASEPVFTSSTLTDDCHTMVITVTGSTTSDNAFIVVDAFDVTGAPPTTIRIEETDLEAISYTGDWFQVCDPRASGGCGEESIEIGAQATLSFTGTGIRWIGWRNEGGGIAKVYVDGILKGEVDTYSPTTETQAEVFNIPAGALLQGPHTLTIEVTGTGTNPTTGTWIIIDAFDVTP